MKILSKLLLLTCAVSLFGCSENKAARHHLKKEKHLVYRTNDGRYVYKSDDGFWYYYMLYSVANGNSSYYVNNSNSAYLPANGGWAAVTKAPDIKEEEPVQEDIEEQENGEPATPEMTQSEFDFEQGAPETSNESDVSSEISESSESSGSESSSDSSSSSDSGGGSD